MSYFPLNSAPIAQYKNYILNPKALSDTSGWTVYRDSFRGPIPDGIGAGSPAITFTRSTSNPLEGPASFLLTTTASDFQGEGVYDEFTIDANDRAKVLTISFDYAFDVTQSTGDWIVYIKDVTNGGMIQPTGYQIQGGVNGTNYKHIATFQTASNASQYRLYIHRAVATATAVNFKIDNVQVGPQVVQYGAPVTDWVSYTPTVSGFGTSPTVSGKWRRVGDSMEIDIQVRVTNTSGAADLNVFLPSGYVADYSKATASSFIRTGTAYYANTSTGAVFIGSVFSSNTSTTQFVMYGDSGLGPWNATVPQAVSTNTQVNVLMRVPITGWSSTVQMSNDTDTRVVGLQVLHSGSQATSAGTWTTATLTTATLDTHGAWNGTDTYTVPVPGLYRISGLLSQNTDAAAYIDVGYRINSGSDVLLGRNIGKAGAAGIATGDALLRLNAGDTIQLRGATEGTQGFNLRRLYVSRLSGPSAIAASESVACRYQLSGTNHVTSGSWLQVTGMSRIYDTHGAFASDTFTAPIRGYYRVSGAVGFNSASTVGARGAQIHKNSVLDTVGVLVNATTTFDTIAGFSKTIFLNAGETIKLFAFQSSGGVLAYGVTANGSQVDLCIERVGN